MNMIMQRRLPTAEEIKEQFPLSAEITKKKAERDKIDNA